MLILCDSLIDHCHPPCLRALLLARHSPQQPLVIAAAAVLVLVRRVLFIL